MSNFQGYMCSSFLYYLVVAVETLNVTWCSSMLRRIFKHVFNFSTRSSLIEVTGLLSHANIPPSTLWSSFCHFSYFFYDFLYCYWTSHRMQPMIQHLIHSLHVSDDVFGSELLLEDERTPQRGKHDILIELVTRNSAVVIHADM